MSFVTEDPDLAEYHFIPDIASLSERMRSCLEETEELPRDFTTLFDMNLFKFDTDKIPEAVSLYKELSVKHEPLTLITPQFETPMPPLQAAVFPPALKEFPPPSLDLFDLDEQFSSEKNRLAQASNKCTDGDLEYYVQECGEILGLTQAIQDDNPMAILSHMMKELIKFKKHNQD